MNKVNFLKRYFFLVPMSAGTLLFVFFFSATYAASTVPVWSNLLIPAYQNVNLPWDSLPLTNPSPSSLLWADPAYPFFSLPYTQALQPAGLSTLPVWNMTLSPAPAGRNAAAASALLSPPVSPVPILPPQGPAGIDTGQIRNGPLALQSAGVTYLPDQPTYVPGQVLVTFLPGTPAAEMSRVYAAHQCCEIYSSPYAGFKVLTIPGYTTVLDMTRQLSTEPSVFYVSPNYYRHAHLLPNDPYYKYQWHLPRLNCSYAWNYATGLGALVALLDSGVAYQTAGVYALAPDLAGTLFVPGYDFINVDAYPNDDYGHGTHMAGCIAQTTNNLLGCAGVAFNATIMPVKVMNNLGSTPISNEADGIYFAANNGAKIINMSLGGTGTSVTEHTAVTYAYNKGVTIICSAGNASSSVPEYPASYTECVSVSAIRYDYTKPAYSNYGLYIDVCSPGGDLTVDQNLDGFGDGILQQTFSAPTYASFYYYFMEGTSPAAALVSGVAALIVSKSTFLLTPLQVTNTLETSATDLGTLGWDQYYGWGLVNAYLAVLRTI
jgi:serine protease